MKSLHLCKATPSGNMVSGQGLSQVKRRVGRFSHYVIIPLGEHDHKNSCCRTVLYTFSNKGIIILCKISLKTRIQHQ